MTLTWPVVGAVLCGALLHACWNAMVKSSHDKAMDMALLQLLGSLVAIPLVLMVGFAARAAWVCIGISVAVHVGYYLTLARAYEHGDLGLTYPLMRGTAPLLVALSATVTLGESLSTLSWLGVLGISAGVLTLGLGQQALHAPKAVGYALVNALIIALYTVVDGLGVRASGNTLQYVATLFLLEGWPFALIVFVRKRRILLVYARQRWPVALGGSIASMGSYGIALWAMTRAPVATVAALRETSVLFAALLGLWFLKEAFDPRRLVGTCVILGGVVALRLG